jgi:hypothetical protein
MQSPYYLHGLIIELSIFPNPFECLEFDSLVLKFWHLDDQSPHLHYAIKQVIEMMNFK